MSPCMERRSQSASGEGPVWEKGQWDVYWQNGLDMLLKLREDLMLLMFAKEHLLRTQMLAEASRTGWISLVTEPFMKKTQAYLMTC